MKPILFTPCAAAMWGQTTDVLPGGTYRWSDAKPAANLCGKNIQNLSANITLLHVGCVDFEALRKFFPEFEWPVGTVTQVLVHIRRGDAVKVTVDGEEKFSNVIYDPNYGGRYLALVQFEGSEHTSVEVKVYEVIP